MGFFLGKHSVTVISLLPPQGSESYCHGFDSRAQHSAWPKVNTLKMFVERLFQKYVGWDEWIDKQTGGQT